MQLPNYVKNVLNALERAGHECYCVGGSVRNSLLSLPIFDYDITTSALPLETKKALCDFRVIETGIKHGTVTALSDSHPIEITTFRSENNYSDHRHPDSVSFSKDLKSDLSRRDFTINAMAYNDKSGIIDIFGGRNDIENRIIRTVGNPDERFNEDALRILRALRFASCLGFDIEKETAKSIQKNYKLLEFVSRERIYSELCRLICGENASEIIKMFSRVFAFIFGESLIYADAIEKGAEALDRLPKEPYIRFASLLRFTDIISAEEILLSLKADKATISSVLNLLSAGKISKPKGRIEIKKLLRIYGENSLKNILILNDVYTPKIEKEISDILKSGECFSLATLKIGGQDLISLDIQGKQIGAVLNEMLTLVIEEKLQNNKENLITYIKNTLL